MAAHPKPFPPRQASLAKATAKPVLAAARKLILTAQAAKVPQHAPIAAAKAKTHLLQLLDEVERNRKPIVITKRGRVVAHLIPAPTEKKMSKFDQVYGSMKGTVEILGDIVSPDWELWGPEWR